MKSKLSNYTTAYCSRCNSDRAIYSKGVTPCPVCGKLLFPCNACQVCLYEACPYDGYTDEELEKNTNSSIPKEKAAKLLKRLLKTEHRMWKWMKRKVWWAHLIHKINPESEYIPF